MTFDDIVGRMKAWRAHGWGEPERMSLDEVERPVPGPDQVLIRNRAVGLNFFDLLHLRGQYQNKLEFPFTVGAEVAGEVEAVGENVRSPRPGERVAAMPMAGGLAEYSTAAASRAFPLPAGMSFEEGAAFPIVYQTSWFALRDRAALRLDERLLVLAAASGVGAAAVQIGKALGARVIAAASDERKRAFCRLQGADEVIDYGEPNWFERVKEIAVDGADVIYDPVGGDAFDMATKCLAPGGRLLVVGFASGRIPTIAMNRVLLKNISIVGVYWGRHAEEHPEYPAETHAELSRLFAAKAVKPPVDRTFPLAQAPAALRVLAQREARGKIVVTVS